MRQTPVLALITVSVAMTALVLPSQAAATTSTQAEPAAIQLDTALRLGSRGPAVAKLKADLLAAKFWVKSTNDVYDATTQQAVMALQKVAKLPRTGAFNNLTANALKAKPLPPVRSKKGLVAEINKSLQVLIIVRDGKVTQVLNTSTGTSATPTPSGTFTIYNEIKGPRRAPLGTLYSPKYFLRGYAIHGSPSIPGYPASHGCARVNNDVMDMLWATKALPKRGTVMLY